MIDERKDNFSTSTAQTGQGYGSSPTGASMPAGSSAGSKIREGVEEAKHKISATASQASETIKQKSNEAMSRARHSGEEAVAKRRNQMAERLHHYESATRRVAQQLRDENDPNIADCAEMIANRLNRVSDYVRDRSIGDVIHDSEELARRHPEAFFGAMFLTGMVCARFLKASRKQRDDEELYGSEPAPDAGPEAASASASGFGEPGLSTSVGPHAVTAEGSSYPATPGHQPL